MLGEPLWLKEIGLGIGRARGYYDGIEREWLYWYDEQGNRYLTPEERVKMSEQEARQAQARAKRLEEKLKSLGLDPEKI